MQSTVARSPAATSRRALVATFVLGALATAIIPVNFVVLTSGRAAGDAVFYALAVLQLVLGLSAAVAALVHVVRARPGVAASVGLVFWSMFAALIGLGGPLGILLVVSLRGLGSMGGAWGRPLRVRGRLLHPALRRGADWTRGARPSAAGLDEATRIALEALWLHDAQKEHASVPAFSRVSWMLAAVGAPAELLIGAHRAALEEIDHAQRCFALAAGYGGRSHTVEGMPELLLGGLDLRGDPRVVLAVESLNDGVLLEDFNADVAARCAEVCEEPASRDVLERIAREERSHARFSWEVLEWTYARWPREVGKAIREALAKLPEVPRPTAVSSEKAALVAAADPEKLCAHGRIPDAEWAALWDARLASTRARVEALLAGESVAAA